MGARMVPANGQTTKTKKKIYMSFWLERLSILLQIYTFACNFCSRKGGACFYWVPCFYWDIYGISPKSLKYNISMNNGPIALILKKPGCSL